MPLEYEVVFKIFPLERCLATEFLVHQGFLVKGQMNQKFDIFYFSSILVKYV